MISKNSDYYPYISAICQKFDVRLDDVFYRRIKEANNAKMVIVRVFRLCGFTYPQIGGLLNKDHTSIIHIDRMIEKYPDYIEMALSFANRIKLDLVTEEKELYKREAHRIKLARERILILFNKGTSVEEIARELKTTEDFINSQLKVFQRLYTKKKVPDYKNNTIREIYVQKI